MDLLDEIPSLKTISYNAIKMLAIFLFRFKTGNLIEVIASIFGIETFNIVSRMINHARLCFEKDFVTQNIGLDSLNRTNLIICNSVISKTI